jgi:hypothetical protein
VFPEPAAVHDGNGAPAPGSVDVDLANVTTILRAAQVLEDVYAACRLDDLWKHPLNRGWANTFARWVTAPTFRMWWPLLAPMFGGDFGRFLQERFGVLRRDLGPSSGRVLRVDPGTNAIDGLAWRWWRHRSDVPPVVKPGAGGFAYVVDLRGADGGSIPVQVAVALVGMNDDTVSWTSNDFHVPQSLWGAGSGGIANRFMLALLASLRTSGTKQCDVCVEMPEERRDDAARSDRVDFVEFYKRYGFRLQSPAEGNPAAQGDTSVRLVLPL